MVLRTLTLGLWIGLFLVSCSSDSKDDSDDDTSAATDVDSDSDGDTDGDTDDGGSFDPPGGGQIEDCPAYSAGHNLDVCTMTYITKNAETISSSVDVHPGGAIVYGGELMADSFSIIDTVLLGGGDAGVIRLSSDGTDVLSVTRMGDKVTDVAISDARGTIAVSGSFGVAVLSSEADQLIWSDDIGGSTGIFVDTGHDGTVAVGHSNHVTVYDKDGIALGDFSVGETSAFNDLAIDTQNELVFVTGYKQRDVGGYCMGKYKAGYLRAFDYQGNAVWTNYDRTAQEVDAVGLCSDTTGRGLTMGKDGYLYYAATSDGGNTVHQKDPKDMSISANNAKPDKYQDPWGLSGAKTIGYFAKFDPTNGDHIVGSFLLTRLSSNPNAGNSVKVITIDADAKGNVFVGGASACCVADGDQKTINDSYAAYNPTYLGGSMFVVMNSDMTERHTWTSPRGENGDLDAVDKVAVGATGGWVALTHQIKDDNKTELPKDVPLLSVDALLDTPGDHVGASHLTVFRGPD